MQTIQALNELATAVQTAAAAFNTAVEAAQAETVSVDVRINYVPLPGTPPALGAMAPNSITVTTSLPLPLV